MATNYAGQQLGNYRLMGLLGQGGFAEVYLGEHVYLKTQAAIKVLKTRLAGPEEMEGFLKEAQTVAHLAHPHIVRILDFGVDGETPFLVMDYAASGTLRQHHPRGKRLPLATVIQYVRQVADALQYAHDEKLVHRDVKPENMLVGHRQNIMLSDFGIALIAQSSRYQSTQDVIGTVAYMSPEQIQGKPRPASDQYSLGIVVYEWLNGERPFSGSFTELCTQHMFAPVPPLREKVPTITPEVEQVVMTALAKDPKQRFGSIQAFSTALEQTGQTETPASSPFPTSTIHPANFPPQLASTSGLALSPAFPPTEAAKPVSQTVPGDLVQKPHEGSTPPSLPVSPWLTRGVARVEKASNAPPVVIPQPDRKPSSAGLWKTIIIGLTGVLLISVMVGSILLLKNSQHFYTFSMEHSDGHLTSCSLGTGYDRDTGTVTGSNDRISSGTTVYLACQVAAGSNPDSMADKLSLGFDTTMDTGERGSIDSSHNVYYNQH